MKWPWFNLAAIVVFFALVLRGVPLLPVLAGIAGAAALNYRRTRVKAA